MAKHFKNIYFVQPNKKAMIAICKTQESKLNTHSFFAHHASAEFAS